MAETQNTKTVTAALIIIGNEILSGRTHDKNIPYVGEKLNKAGVQLLDVRVIPDIEARIVDTVNALRTRYDYVFTTGGIGPTHDDITSESVAKAFGLSWDKHDEAWDILKGYYDSIDQEFTPARQKMAKTPKGAKLVDNPVSGAPGFNIENVFVFAGIPRIMQAMLDSVVPNLKGGAEVLSVTVMSNHPESKIADALGEVAQKFPNVDIGSYPRYSDGKFNVSVILRGTDAAELERVRVAVEAVVF